MTNGIGGSKHWEAVFTTKSELELSWYQSRPHQSLGLVERYAEDRELGVIDVGGGTSALVDGLLEAGYTNVTVLELTASAIDRVRGRLGAEAQRVTWINDDVTSAQLEGRYGLWHDRAVFHFLTSPEAKAGYLRTLSEVLVPGGYVVVSAFAADGPERCSGLPVVRYTSSSLLNEFGDEYELVESFLDGHQTPWGSIQSFVYCVFRRKPNKDELERRSK